MDRRIELLDRLRKQIDLLIDFSPQVQELIKALEQEGVSCIEIDTTVSYSCSPKTKDKPSAYDKKWVGRVQ